MFVLCLYVLVDFLILCVLCSTVFKFCDLYYLYCICINFINCCLFQKSNPSYNLWKKALKLIILQKNNTLISETFQTTTLSLFPTSPSPYPYFFPQQFTRSSSLLDTNMNFAKAVKGPRTRSYKLNFLNSQAEVELGHKLSNAEISQLANRFSIDYVFDTSERVRIL